MLYNVMIRENNTQEFDNLVGDYTEAETKEEAIELVKQWLIDNGYTDDVEELEFRVEEVKQAYRHPEYFTEQGQYIWENGLEGQVEDVMEKMPCSRETAITYVYLMNRAFNGID